MMRDGAVVRAFTCYQCGVGLILTWCHKWVEFVVGSRLASQSLVLWFSFLPPLKPTPR